MLALSQLITRRGIECRITLRLSATMVFTRHEHWMDIVATSHSKSLQRKPELPNPTCRAWETVPVHSRVLIWSRAMPVHWEV